MSTKRIYADTDDTTTENDLDNSDNTDNGQELEEESDPWQPLKIEAEEKDLAEFEDL